MALFSSQFVPDSSAVRSRLGELVTRGGAGIAVLAVALGVGLWLWFAGSDDASSGAAAQPGAQNNAIPVVVAQPQLDQFAQEVEALGTLRANESVDITAKVADRVARIHFEEGQQVRAGQVLVELETEEARAELAAAEAAATDARSQFKRSQELLATRALSEAQMDQVRATMLASEAQVAAARSRVNDRVITAPFTGRVGLRRVSLGGFVSPGEVITTLDDLSVMKLDFSVPEVFLATVRPGLRIEARSDAYPKEVFAGRVDSVDTRVDPTTRSISIRALIENREGRLRPGMFMTVKLVRSEGQALMLPERAIVPEGDRHFVFVLQGETVRKQEVEIGRRRPGEVEILSGVTPEDRVVVDGTLNVREGAPVRVQVPLQNSARSG